MAARPVHSAAPLSEREIFLYGCLGFVVPYLGLFVIPTFFGHEWMFRPEPLPTFSPVGGDLRQLLSWGPDGRYPAGMPSHGYPPLSNVFLAVMHRLPFSVAYAVLTATTLALFLLLLGLPLHHARARHVPPLVAMFLITGLLSYGLQFEIERGQFNVLAFGLSAGGVWLFHAKPRWRMLAYALFCAGIQLKLYPAILGLLLIADYRDWKGTLRRAGGLAAVNVLLLFSLGPGRLVEFVSALNYVAYGQGFSGWSINHSIDSFVTFVITTLSRHLVLPAYASAVAEWTLLLSWFACISAILGLNYRDRQSGLDPYLLLACAISALVIPPISSDYKLSLLVAPTAMAVVEFERYAGSPSHPRRPGIAALVMMIAAYATTLFPYSLKPTLLDNNCLALLVMLGCVTAMAAIRSTVRASATLAPLPRC